jgi:pyruvate, water dikinase
MVDGRYSILFFGSAHLQIELCIWPTIACFFKDISINDVPSVGGKNASLGEMYNQLSGKGVNVPNGFAVTVAAFEYFITANKLKQPLSDLMADLNKETFANLREIGEKARTIMLHATLPEDLKQEIIKAYEIFNTEQLNNNTLQ